MIVVTMKRLHKTVLAPMTRMFFLFGLVARIVVEKIGLVGFSVHAFELRVEKN